MFDPLLHKLRLNRAIRRFSPDNAFLMDRVREELIDRLGAVKREFGVGLALGGRTSALSNAMVACGQVGQTLRLEEGPIAAHEACSAFSLGSLPSPNLPLSDQSVDLVMAPLTLHWSNDLPGLIADIARVLRPDGLFLAALPGPETLHELRSALLQAESEATGSAALRVDPFTSVQDAGSLLQRAGLALPVVDQDVLTVRYGAVSGLVRDLRHFGASAHFANRPPPLARGACEKLEAVYWNQFRDADKRLRATFQMIYLSGWKPHESQQKPARRGSAQISLVDVLERKAD